MQKWDIAGGSKFFFFFEAYIYDNGDGPVVRKLLIQKK